MFVAGRVSLGPDDAVTNMAHADWTNASASRDYDVF